MYADDGKSRQYTAALVQHFRDRKVADIGPGDIRAAASVIYPDAKPATWNRQVIVPARAIINHAASKNLAAYIRVKNFKELRPFRRAPSADWLPAFMAHADNRTAALALFMRITAARIGQAISLEWDAVDLQRAMALIPAAKGYPEQEAALTPEMVALLANLKKGERVFGYEHRWSVYKPWKAACEAARIPYVSPHSAGRRAFATAMRAAGVDPKTAAKRGRWASIRLMLDVYTDADENPDLINEVFGKRVTNKGKQVDRIHGRRKAD